jgi:sugar O-acyltransferase (sialic acid O-acetyltransferase NeuD family)
MTDKKPLLVLGARKYAPVFADSFGDVDGFQMAGFVENEDRGLCEQTIMGLPVHWIDDIAALSATHLAICCLATVERDRIVEAVGKQGFSFATLRHPDAVVSRRSSLGPGTSIDAGAVIAGFTTLDSHVRVGRGATIGHHIRIRDYSTVHPGVNIASACEIGPKAVIGIGATVIEGCRIGAGSFVAAGAVVSRSVPDGAFVAGSPARIVAKKTSVVAGG